MGQLSYIVHSHTPPQLDGIYIPNMTDGVHTSAAPPTSGYPELTTPYSAVSSFNFPTRADSSLLTPISTSGSPDLHQSHKFTPRYHNPPGTPRTQEGTPPESSRMYSWTNQFDMNGQASGTSSPMPHQATVAQGFLGTHYLSGDRRPTPGPPDPYTGCYGVSDDPEHHDIQQPGGPYYTSMLPVDHGLMGMGDDSPIPVKVECDMNHHQMSSTAPLLGHPHPSQLRTHRRDGSEEAMFVRGTGLAPPLSGSPRRRAGNPRARKNNKAGGRRANPGRTAPPAENPQDEHTNCRGQEVPPPIKDICPPEERCIFASRWAHRNKKGQDMWESIQNDFKKQFNKNPGKEMLQMKYKRARSRYFAWLPEDEDILRDAWNEIEKTRHQLVLEKFLEMGGSRNMQLNAGDVEVKLVNDLKLEDRIYMEDHTDVSVRRRRKQNARKRSAGRVNDECEMSLNDEITSVSSHNTINDEDVINQVHNRRFMNWNDDSALSPEMMDMHSPPLKMEPGMVPEHGMHQAHDTRRQGSYNYPLRKGN